MSPPGTPAPPQSRSHSDGLWEYVGPKALGGFIGGLAPLVAEALLYRTVGRARGWKSFRHRGMKPLVVEALL
eukprot:910132-Prymnesium_polylepis.1